MCAWNLPTRPVHPTRPRKKKSETTGSAVKAENAPERTTVDGQKVKVISRDANSATVSFEGETDLENVPLSKLGT